MKKTFAPIFAFLLAASAAVSVQAADVVPNAKAGEGKISLCIGCHGIPDYHASFPQVYHVPEIGGQTASYITDALKAYKAGDRKFPTMQAVAASLSDQDIADIAAYYSEQNKPQAPATQPPAPPAVQAILEKANCASCHGANFSTPLAASMPKLAGQHADYLYAALKSYNAPDNAAFGRSNAVMGGVVKGNQLTHKEMQMLADYIGSLKGDVATVPEGRFKK